ncbi:LOW QUALITY PROTEIN: hypothetical protein PHMEG_00028890 [Phytophthora megakarya]|uniref:Uncharacterized protein n=1 Tax=Phytophthora megakarya TaxID=4795 RepID=A0A225V6F7_9STRA|nr:LOW QUALITY PROTEIN: hypothetical protein PHMEG_00028890 [Phytophthora megakarya]
MWSMTGDAAQHMQFTHALPGGMVFAAQGDGIQSESSLGVQVTEDVLPVSPMPANPDDVVMSESGRVIIGSDNRWRTSRKYAHRLRSSPSDDSPIQRRRSETLAFEAFEAVIQTVAKSVDQVGNDEPLRKVALFGDVALNAMRSTQDMSARMESKQDTTQDQLNQRVDQAFQAIQMLAARPGVVKNVAVPNVEAPTAPVQAVPSEATSHEVIRALKAAETQLQERRQRREAEAKKATESWATKSLNDQWESVMSAQMQRLQEEITSLKKARNQDPKANRRTRIQDRKEERLPSEVTTDGGKKRRELQDKEPPKKKLRTKPSRQDEDHSGPSSSGESSEEDDSSSDPDSSSDDMPPYTIMVTNAKGGNMLTLRTFTNALDDFDEKHRRHVVDDGRSS